MISPLSSAGPRPSFLKLSNDQSTSSWMCSIPTTLPPGLTRWCRTAARYPDPLPTSRTLDPGRRWASKCSAAYACFEYRERIQYKKKTNEQSPEKEIHHVRSADRSVVSYRPNNMRKEYSKMSRAKKKNQKTYDSYRYGLGRILICRSLV